MLILGQDQSSFRTRMAITGSPLSPGPMIGLNVVSSAVVTRHPVEREQHAITASAAGTDRMCAHDEGVLQPIGLFLMEVLLIACIDPGHIIGPDGDSQGNRHSEPRRLRHESRVD